MLADLSVWRMLGHVDRAALKARIHHLFANVASSTVAVESNQQHADICQSLVQLTPIPALPAYYCLYRAFSHRQALAGCRALTDAFSHHDAQQLQVGSCPLHSCMSTSDQSTCRGVSCHQSPYRLPVPFMDQCNQGVATEHRRNLVCMHVEGWALA